MPPPQLPKTMPTPVPAANTSRKRQHDEIFVEPSAGPGEDSDTHMSLPPARTPTISPDLSHGEVVPITNPLTGQQGQTGARSESWFESTLQDRLGPRREDPPRQIDGPASQTTKRQCVREEPASKVIDFAADASSAGLQTPQADRYTQALGVGWAGLRQEPEVLAAARGYCRYIQNHYFLSDVVILAKGSVEGYLVKTNEGYYLFRDDLREGGLIARELEQALEKLKNPDFDFEGSVPRRWGLPSDVSSIGEIGVSTSTTEADSAGDVPMAD